MKLHLPVKLRASLIAAVIAVSASVYNAYGAHTYKSEFGSNQFEFSSAITGVDGNQYIVETFNSYTWTDGAGNVHEIAQNVDGEWCKVERDAAGKFVQLGDEITENIDESTLSIADTSVGSIIFNITDDADKANFEGNTQLKADSISFNNNLETVNDGANGRTEIETETLTVGQSGDNAATELKTSVALKNVDITASATVLGAKDRLTIDNSSAAAADAEVSLGAVSGTGSLTVTGSKTYDAEGNLTSQSQGVEMDSVELQNKGSLELTNVDATIGGDVHVNDLILTDNDSVVTGDVTINGALTVDEKSSLTASGDILSNPVTDGTGSVVVDGRITSTGGDIVLDNSLGDTAITGTVEATSTVAGKGNINLHNIDVTDGATISATGDLTLTGNSTIIDNPEAEGEEAVNTTVSVGGDLTVDDSTISGVTATVGGAITVENGGKIDGSTLTDATGDITIEGGVGSDVTNTLIDGGRHFKLDGSMDDVTLAGTKIINLTGDIKIANTTRDGLELSTMGTTGDDVTDYDDEVGGSIIVENSTLANSSIKSGVSAEYGADGTITYSNVTRGTVVRESNGADAGIPWGNIIVKDSTITSTSLTANRGAITVQGTSAKVVGATNGSYLAPPPNGGKAGAYAITVNSLTAIGVDSAANKISSISILEADGGSGKDNAGKSVYVKLFKDGSEIATSNKTTLKGEHRWKSTFDFESPVDIDPAATYTLKFYSADGTEYECRLALTEKSDGPTKTSNTGVANWNAIVMADYLIDPSDDVAAEGWTPSTTLINSTITSGEGNVNIERAKLIGTTIATEDGTLTMSKTHTSASEERRTIIAAKSTSTIRNSVLDGGTDVTVKNGDLTVYRSQLLKDVNIKTGGYFDFKDETVADIDGGEAHNASLIVGTTLWADQNTSVANDTINIKNANVQVKNDFNLYGGSTVNLTNVYAKAEDGTISSSTLGRLSIHNNGGRGVLNIQGSKINLTAIQGTASNWPAANTHESGKYFGEVNVDKDSTVVVRDNALIDTLKVNGLGEDTADGGSTVQVMKAAYLETAEITGANAGVTVNGNGKVQNLTLTGDATMRFEGTGTQVSTIANLLASDGVIEVVNGKLTTPVMESDTLVLGLSGGEVTLAKVNAIRDTGDVQRGTTADTVVTEHVVLAGVTNAGIENNTAVSTIKTAGLNRLESYASNNEGTNVTLEGLRYLYTVTDDAFTATADMKLWVKDATTGEWTLIESDTPLARGTEVSKINYETVAGETQYDGTSAATGLIGIVDADATLPAELVGKLQAQTTTLPDGTTVEVTGNLVMLPIGQLAEKETIEVTSGFSHNPGAAPVVNDGIASLTVNGDFGADNTLINAYRLAEPVSYWKDAVEYSVDQYKAMIAAGVAQDEFTPMYQESDKVYYTITNTAFSGMASDGTYSDTDKAIYTQLKSLYTGTVYYSAKEKLAEADWNKFTYDENGTYTRTISTQADFDALADKTDWIGKTTNTYTWTETIDQTAYDALTDKSSYVANADGTYTKTVTVDQAGYDALADKTGYIGAENNVFTHTLQYSDWNALADNTQYIYNEDGTYTIKETITNAEYRALDADERAGYVKIGDDQYVRSLTVEVAGSLAAEDIKNGQLDENERWYTTIINGTDSGDWFEETIKSDRDGLGYSNTFIDEDGLHFKSDDTGYINIAGDLSGSTNEFNADDTISVGSISGSDNKLTASTTITTGAITGTGNILNANGEAVDGDDATIKVGDINSGNKLTAVNGDIVTGAITGAGNALTAGTTITTGAISSSENGLTAGTSITAASIAGDSNQLTAGTTVVITGVLQGNNNTLIAQNGHVELQAEHNALVGNNNTITAVGGDVKVKDDINGNGNIITATAVKDADGNIISGGAIISHNDGWSDWASLKGSLNVLTADANIKIDTLEGSNNTLQAGTSITTGAISSTGSALTAGTTINTGAISGSTNTLKAENGSITTNRISGDGNTLTAGTTVTVNGGIVGTAANGADGNIITANGGNVVLGGSGMGNTTHSIVGNNNEITAVGGDVEIKDDITGNNNIIKGGSLISESSDRWGVHGGIVGNANEVLVENDIVLTELKGNNNKLTAGGEINLIETSTTTTKGVEGNNNTVEAGTSIITGMVKGSTNTLTAGDSITSASVAGTSNTLTAATVTVTGAVTGTDQKVLSTGVTNASDDAINIGTLSATDSTIQVTAPNSGSIVIGTLSAQSVAGETGNIISTDAGNVSIGTLNTTAKTSIYVSRTDSIIVGSGTASNQYWEGGNLTITGDAGITLNNSDVVLSGNIEGTSLTLTGDTTVDAYKVVLDTLTLVGKDALIDATKLTVTNVLELTEGATLGGQQIKTDEDGATLKVTNSTLTYGMLEGFNGVILENSTGLLGGSALGTVDKPMTGGVTALDKSTLTAGSINTVADVTADASKIDISGDVKADDMHITNGGSISAADVTLTGVLNAAGGKLTATSVTGATNAALNDATITDKLVMADAANANVTATNGTVIGSIANADSVTLTDSKVKEDVGMNGTLSMTNSSVGGDVTGANGADLDNATITGDLNATGAIVADSSSIGSIKGSASSVTLTDTEVGDIEMSTSGDLVVSGGSTGAITNGTVANATLTNTEIGSGLNVTGNMTSNGTVTVDGAVTVGQNLAVNAGTLTADSVEVTGKTTLTDATVNADTFTTGELELESINGVIGELEVNSDAYIAGTTLTVTDSITVDGDMSVVDSAKVTNEGAAEITGDLTVNNASFTNKGEITVGGAASVTNGGELTGSSLSADSVTVNAGSITGDVTATEGAVSVTNGTIAGDVTATEGGVSVTNGTIAGDVDAKGDVIVDGSTIGDVKGAAVTLTGSDAGAVTATGAATLSNATINGALSAADTVVSNEVKVTGTANVADLTVNKGATLTTAEDLTANGKLDIQSAVTATKGDVALTGADGSSITADVTAADGNVIIAGTVAATEATLKGDEVQIDGTLNAGKGLSLAGTVTGDGTIVKTGGDTLVLAGDTEIGGVTVKDKSTLDAAGSIGTLTVIGSTLQIAGADNAGTLEVDGGSIDGASTVEVDINCPQKNRAIAGSDDKIVGNLTVNGATIKLKDHNINEAGVADGDSIKLVDGKVSGSGFNADVEHSYNTLNVHAENGNIVFSKNYKGVENKTENQSATADALQSITSPAGELASVMDALNHTRSGADALKALDSLSGAGLTAAPKLVVDETKEHLQTLRNTLQSVAEGLARRYTETGVRLNAVESTAVSASVTGGSSTVNGNDNAEEYKRSSMGAMLTVAHAINSEWTFGGALSVSQGDADCGNTTVESQGIFLDVGVMQKRGRFSQMGSIGCALFSMDTERQVGVNAAGHSYAGTAEGSMDAAAFTMTYETSYAIWQTESYSFSSVVMAEMLFAQVDNMEEDGMGNAGLRSSFDDVAALTFGVGGRYTYHFGETYNPGYFSAEAMFVADAGDSVTKVNNTFIGGGNSFQLSGPDAGNYGLRLNAGVLLPIGDQWGLFGNVTGEIRSEQTTVGGSVGVKYAF